MNLLGSQREAPITRGCTEPLTRYTGHTAHQLLATQSYLNGACVGFQPFGASKGGDGVRLSRERGGFVLDDGAAGDEVIDAEWSAEPSRPARGQYMGGPGQVVAHRLGRSGTDK